jgi:hypothetical protein
MNDRTFATPSQPRLGEAYVAFVQALRQSNAAGKHRKTRKDRANIRRKAIEQSRTDG